MSPSVIPSTSPSQIVNLADLDTANASFMVPWNMYNKNFSISFWVKPKTVAMPPAQLTWSQFIGTEGGGDSWHIGMYSNRIYFGAGDGYSFPTTPAFTAGTWTHVVCMRNMTTKNRTIYINGVKFFEGVVTDARGDALLVRNGPAVQYQNLSSVLFPSSPNEKFNGFFSSLGIWERELAPVEVLAIYNGTRTLDLTLTRISGLVGYYKFSPSNGDITDSSGASKHLKKVL
jgi:hypothetical protein